MPSPAKKLSAVQICDYMRAIPRGKDPFDQNKVWWALMVKRPDGVWILVAGGPASSMLWVNLGVYLPG